MSMETWRDELRRARTARRAESLDPAPEPEELPVAFRCTIGPRSEIERYGLAAYLAETAVRAVSDPHNSRCSDLERQTYTLLQEMAAAVRASNSGEIKVSVPLSMEKSGRDRFFRILSVAARRALAAQLPAAAAMATLTGSWESYVHGPGGAPAEPMDFHNERRGMWTSP